MESGRSISKPGVIPRPLAPQLQDHVLRPRSIGMYSGAGDPPFPLNPSPLRQRANRPRHRDDNRSEERPHRWPHFKDKPQPCRLSGSRSDQLQMPFFDGPAPGYPPRPFSSRSDSTFGWATEISALKKAACRRTASTAGTKSREAWDFRT